VFGFWSKDPEGIIDHCRSFHLQLIALGTRRIAQAGLAFFMFAGVYWIAILPLPNGFIGPGED